MRHRIEGFRKVQIYSTTSVQFLLYTADVRSSINLSNWFVDDDKGVKPNCEALIKLRSAQKFQITSQMQDSISLHAQQVRLTGR